ncbi:sulfurtransferase [Rathayibacter rathayi]|uniref:rhodanese-like domain-containing protein n=1 Tax=Rathayibacter rathayi TaxID=33887 RepID=UPI000CE78F06|nr:rhodanese-like domain-containing protein [Rathayibacter rathayi]PPF25115.1 sulfurtransferase [Rathayibacter rathayi]PPG71875.1 sulfurtransferase [Rathayibacter rathayi]PPG79065.1 sulfurtransferase [Rathayibacter rathayi]PPG90303.1 sulfurtransferase [Rathayibacter rathayi]PPG97502.1 sulfurtransferase [Rathayibacter rathayi]
MKSITVHDLAATIAPTVLDVREPDEYATGHARGAVNLPLSQLGQRLNEVPADRPVHIICQSGGRSSQATEALADRGYDVIDVTGGTSAWIAADLPVDHA